MILRLCDSLKRSSCHFQESATYYLPNPLSEYGGDAVVFKLANGGQVRRSRESRTQLLCTVAADLLNVDAEDFCRAGLCMCSSGKASGKSCGQAEFSLPKGKATYSAGLCTISNTLGL
jgi:hypothetical protein